MDRVGSRVNPLLYTNTPPAGPTTNDITIFGDSRWRSDGTPRLRVNRSASLALSNTWTTLDFSGTSQYNTNSFPRSQGQTNQQVWYDASTQTVKFTPMGDRNYVIFLSASVTSSILLTSLNLTTFTFGSLRMRCYVPSPTPVVFPIPDSGGYLDMGPVNLLSQTNLLQPLPLYANQLIRDYGFRVQAALSNPVLGTVTLTAADLNLFRV